MTDAGADTHKPEPDERVPPILLRSYALKKRYGAYQVLDGVDLEVREGNVYGFLGRNG